MSEGAPRPERQVLIVLGSPKSGTTWLQVMLGAHPAIATTVEQRLFSQYVHPWLRAWREEVEIRERGRWNQGLPFVWTEARLHAFLRCFVEGVYASVAQRKPGATHVLDKHPAYALHVGEILTLLPDARLLHVIRDGRDVAASMTAARRSLGYGPGTISRAARDWRRHVLAARAAGARTQRYHEVRYEDLLARTGPTLAAAFDFCGVKANAEQVAEIADRHGFERMQRDRVSADERVRTDPAFYRKGRAGAWPEDLGAVDRYRFHHMAGNLLCELGYARPGWWARSKLQRLTLPLLAALPPRGRTRV